MIKGYWIVDCIWSGVYAINSIAFATLYQNIHKRTNLFKYSIFDIISFCVVMQILWKIAFFQARLFCGDHRDLVLFFLLHFPCIHILWGHFYDKNHFVDRYYHSEPVTRYHSICNIRRDIHNLRCKLRIYRGKKITKLE